MNLIKRFLNNRRQRRQWPKNHKPFKVVEVCTYNGGRFSDEVSQGRVEEYGNPYKNVYLTMSGGLQAILGDLKSGPVVTFERQPDRWVLIVGPSIGWDDSLLVHILDPETEDGDNSIDRQIVATPNFHAPNARNIVIKGYRIESNNDPIPELPVKAPLIK